MTTPTERVLPVTLDLPSSLYREIGRVMAAHALVEWVLNRIVYQLLGIPPVEGRTAVREPRTPDRVDMITDLLDINKIKIDFDFDALKEALNKAFRERDALAHGVWQKDEEAGQIFLRLAAGKWQPPGMNRAVKRRIDLEAREYTAQEAKETGRLILGILDALNDLDDKVATVLRSSRRKSRARYRAAHRRPGRAPKKPATRRGPSPP